MHVKHEPSMVREYNQKMVYNVIHTRRSISRIDIAKLTQMSPASISKIVGNLLEEGLIQETGLSKGNRGRKPVLLAPKPDGILTLGVNVDARRISAGLVDVLGQVILYEEEANSPSCDVTQLTNRLLQIIERLRRQMTEKQLCRLIGVGVSVPGVVTYPEGRISFSPQFKWRDYPLRAELERALDINVLVDNNVKAVAVAEQVFGITQNISDYVIVQVGSGIGGAVVSNGKLYRGENNMTGEFGHILIRRDGPLCDCGRRGCLQSFTCISGIESLAERKISQVLADAEAGDERCQRILDDAVEHLAMWLANLVNFYNPKLTILYGELLELWPTLFEQVRLRVMESLWLKDEGKLHLISPEVGEKPLTALSSAAILLAETIYSEIVIHETNIDNHILLGRDATTEKGEGNGYNTGKEGYWTMD